MKIKFTGILILVILAVAVSSCHRNQYKTMHTKAEKNVNYNHNSHYWKKHHARPRYYRKNGYW